MGRTIREKEDIGRAEESADALRERLAALEREFREEAAKVEEGVDAAGLVLERTEVRPRKSDVAVVRVSLVWTPWRVTSDGTVEPAWR